MSKDIGRILDGWEYKPNELSVRKIMGKDGKPKIQLRLDMGLLQMEAQGRPDGRQPHGKNSLLEHYQSILSEHWPKYGTDEHFKLNSEDCLKLQQEAIQYYYRYLSSFQLKEFEAVERDTSRNLQVLDLVKKYAAEERDKQAFEQYRPYIIMMNTRAKGFMSLARKDYEAALQHIQDGIRRIEQFFKEQGREDLLEESTELAILRDWVQEIQQDKPRGLKERLEEQLKKAVEKEEYEKAARLRDQIKRLDDRIMRLRSRGFEMNA